LAPGGWGGLRRWASNPVILRRDRGSIGIKISFFQENPPGGRHIYILNKNP